MLPPIRASNIPDTRRQIEDPPLWQSSSNQSIDVTVSVPDGFQPTRRAETIKESCNSFVEVCTDLMVWNARDGGIRRYGIVEDCERVTVTVSRGWGGELEDGRCR